MTPDVRRRNSGFTLTELAVVMAIIALLIGTMMVPLSAQQDLRGRQDTDKALADIREALIGFALVNGRLPCPADRTLPTPTGTTCPGASGCEVTTGSAHSLACTNNPGAVPWATLGLSETDYWGRRFTYRVDPVFARGIDPSPTLASTYGTGCAFTQTSDMPTKAAFALCTQGALSIASGGGNVIANNIPAVVVSHGTNGRGAYLPNGQLYAAASGSELANTGTGTTFVSDTTLDDQLAWIAPGVLMNRMLTAGRLP